MGIPIFVENIEKSGFGDRSGTWIQILALVPRVVYLPKNMYASMKII